MPNALGDEQVPGDLLDGPQHLRIPNPFGCEFLHQAAAVAAVAVSLS
jgi:hypothetical protein